MTMGSALHISFSVPFSSNASIDSPLHLYLALQVCTLWYVEVGVARGGSDHDLYGKRPCTGDGKGRSVGVGTDAEKQREQDQEKEARARQLTQGEQGAKAGEETGLCEFSKAKLCSFFFLCCCCDHFCLGLFFSCTGGIFCCILLFKGFDDIEVATLAISQR